MHVLISRSLTLTVILGTLIQPVAQSNPRTDETFLRLRFIRNGTEEPVAGVLVGLEFEGYGGTAVVVEGSDGEADQVLTTDQEGRVRFRVRENTTYVADVKGWMKAYESTRVVVAPLAAGESRDRTVALIPGRELSFHAKLLDRETDRPIVGAEVWVGPDTGKEWATWTSTGRKWRPVGKLAAVTGSHGQFRLTWRSWYPSPSDQARIHAEGYGPVLVRATGTRPRQEEPAMVYASRIASATGLVLDSRESPIRGAVIKASTVLFPVQGDEPSWDIQSYVWSTKTDEKGRFKLNNLPAHQVILVEVPGFPLQLFPTFKLLPGETRNLSRSDRTKASSGNRDKDRSPREPPN